MNNHDIERDSGGHEVWRLTAGMWAAVERQTSGELGHFGMRGDDWLAGKGKERRVLLGDAAKAAIVVALGGTLPLRVIVRSSEKPSARLDIWKTDPDGSAVVHAIVALKRPREETTFTISGWAYGHERGRGEWRKGFAVPAHLLSRSILRDFPELRELVQRGEFG